MSNASSELAPAPKPSVPKVPWNPWVGILFVVIIFFAAQVLSAALLWLYPLIQGWTTDQTLDWLGSSITVQFIYIVLTQSLILGAVYVYLRFYKKNFSIIGLRRPRWSDLAWGFSAVVPYFLLYFLTVGVVSHFVPGFDAEQKQELGFNDVVGMLPMLMTFISLVVIPPIAEEILVRGFLYSSLKKALPMIYAVIGTSLIFAVAHLSEGGAAGPLYIAALDTFVLSLVLIYLREKTGGLWASMTLHAIKNGIAFTALFVFHVS